MTEELLSLAALGFTAFNFMPAGPRPAEQAELLAAEVLPALRLGQRASGSRDHSQNGRFEPLFHIARVIKPDMPVNKMQNAVLQSYLDQCASDPELASAGRALALPEEFGRSYGKLLLDRPLFIDEGEIITFAADLSAIFGSWRHNLGCFSTATGAPTAWRWAPTAAWPSLILKDATGSPPL